LALLLLRDSSYNPLLCLWFTRRLADYVPVFIEREGAAALCCIQLWAQCRGGFSSQAPGKAIQRFVVIHQNKELRF
jgi:hypothetical protein